MRVVYEYDANGFLKDTHEIGEYEVIPINCTNLAPNKIRPRFVNGEWVDGVTEEEKAELLKSPVDPVEELRRQQTDLIFELMMKGVLQMDWNKIAQNDWDIYHDKTRISMYVQKGKISSTQYELITGDPYE